MTRVVLVLALLAACEKKQQPAPAPVAAGDASVASDSAVAVMPVAIDAAPVDAAVQIQDGGPVDYSKLVTAEWPTALEIVELSPSKSMGWATYYKFRTRPPELGKLMNVWMETFAAAAKSPAFDVVNCSISTSSRIAVVGRCKTMGTTPPEGHGGAPAGEDPTFFGWWMQPGLPAITIDQLAPNVDVKKLIAQTYAAAPKDCPLDQCRFDPAAFLLDAEGVTFEPAEYCAADCLRPTIALEDLHPTHPWGKKLVEWMRQRVEAYESVVKYVTLP